MSDPTRLEDEADRAALAGRRDEALRLLEQAAAGAAAGAGLWQKLSAMRRGAGDLAGALDAIDRSLALAPLDFPALLARATLLEKLGRPAGEEYGFALAQLPAGAVLPPAMKAAVDHARTRRDAYRAQLEERLGAQLPATLEGSERERALRFASNISRRTRHFHQEPTHFHYPGLPEAEFHDRGQFPWLAGLEARTDEIRAELEALLATDAADIVPYIQYPERAPTRQWAELNHNRDWSAIHLLKNGARVERNAGRCPRTMEILASLPQPAVPTASPNAMFSLLAPGTRIPPHVGVANTRLVAHLALVVPPECGFRVGATTRAWREGEAFVFDDTIEHEAWNESDRLRVVMIFDVWAPALSREEQRAVAAMIPLTGTSFTGGL